MRKLLLTAMLSYLALLACGQTNVFWRADGPASGDWQQGDNPCNEHGQSNAYPWWYPDWNPNEARGRPDCHDSNLGHRIHFNNDYQTNMDLNLSWYNAHQILFQNNANRTINGVNGIDMLRNGAKIENQSAGTHTFNAPIAYHTVVQINPLNGNLIFNSEIFNNGNWTDVWGGTSNFLTISGGLSGAGGLTVKDNTNVIITSSASYSGATLIEAGTLELQGSIASSAVTVNSGAKLTINGTNVEVASLTIQSGGLVEIEPGMSLTVNGTLTNSAGNGGLVIKDGGSLIHNTANVPATIERIMPGSNSWRMVSAPVSGMTVHGTDWAPTLPNTEYDLYWFKEDVNEIGGNYFPWINIRATNGELNPEFDADFISGRGYLSAFVTGGDKEFAGNLNSGDVSIAITRTATTNDAIKGWNLIGNPYTSGYEWDGNNYSILADNYAYVLTADGTYDPRAATTLAPNQGFFVNKGTDGSENFVFQASRRVHGGAFAKHGMVSDQLVLVLSNGALVDRTTIQMIEGTSFDRDRWDALKLYSLDADQRPQLSTQTANGTQVAINTIPSLDESLVIPIRLNIPANGTMTISADEITGQFEQHTLVLFDQKTGNSHKLNETPVYSFIASTDNPNRFLLKFSAVGIDEAITQPAINAWVYSNTLFVNNPEGSTRVEIIDLAGRILYAGNISGEGIQSMNINQPAGVYIVRMSNAGSVATIKAAIK